MFPRSRYKSPSELGLNQIKDPVGTIKYDGAAFFMQIGADGSPRYYSRRQSVRGHYPDRTDQLPHLADVRLPALRGNVYHVELIHTGADRRNVESHPKVSGILNSLPPRAIETQRTTGPVRAVLLDVIEPSLPTYGDKLVHMKEVEKMVGKPDVFFAPEVAIGLPAIVRLTERTKKTGREGVIVTSLTQPEATNSRQKTKHVDTYNLKVIRVQQEIDIRGNPKESMGALVVADATGREVAAVGTGFTRDDRISIWKNRLNWIGREIQVKTFGTVKEFGKLRAPVYNGLSDSHLDIV